MTKLNKLSPNLMVGNVHETLDFYCKTLGFDFVMAVPADENTILTAIPSKERKLLYAVVKRDSTEVMFQAKESLAQDVPAFADMPIAASVSFYFEVTGLHDLYERIKPEVEIVKDLHTTWYGLKEFYVRDCNGYILGFSERAS